MGWAFISFGWLAECAKALPGPQQGTSCTRLGHVSLTWAFSETAVLSLRHHSPVGQKVPHSLSVETSQRRGLDILTHKLARTVYDLLKSDTAFAGDKCLHE
jgi:hypothetical protein